MVLDRTGTSLLSAGDNDLAACACDIGLGVGLFSSLNLTHMIPAARLEEDYLLRLVEGISFSGVIFRSFRADKSFLAHRRWSTRAADFLRLLRMNERQRRFFRASKRGEILAYKYLSEAQSRG
jgi:hypothetical protein